MTISNDGSRHHGGAIVINSDSNGIAMVLGLYDDSDGGNGDM